MGPGFLETVYRRALLMDLKRSNIKAETEKEIAVKYEGIEVGMHRLDIIVEGTVIVELKTVDELSRAHYAQVRSYLRATNLTLALLVNFAKERADFRRIESISISHPIP
jgi:GxxExxY protein